MCDLAIAALLASVARRAGRTCRGGDRSRHLGALPAAIRIAAGGLETTLAMACEVGLVAAWMWAADRPTLRPTFSSAALAAWRILARIDAVLLVGILTAIALWRGPRKQVLQTGLAAIAVVAPWWLYCIAKFGSPIPASSSQRSLQSGRPAAPADAQPGRHQRADRAVGRLDPLGGDEREPRGDLAVLGCRSQGLAVVATAGLLRSRRSAGSRAGTGTAVRNEGGRCSPQLGDRRFPPLFGIALIVFYSWYNISYYAFRYGFARLHGGHPPGRVCRRHVAGLGALEALEGSVGRGLGTALRGRRHAGTPDPPGRPWHCGAS